MDDFIIKEALSYSYASDLHDIWRSSRKKKDGTYEVRIKKSKDEVWNAKYGTDEVDIANTSFSDLPSNWQYENLEAARVVISLVFDKVMTGKTISSDEIEQIASIIHNEWLRRNDWVYDPNYGNPKLAVPYVELEEEEKEKDKAQVIPAQRKVQDYKDGLIDIDEICRKYNIILESKVR